MQPAPNGAAVAIACGYQGYKRIYFFLNISILRNIAHKQHMRKTKDEYNK